MFVVYINYLFLTGYTRDYTFSNRNKLESMRLSALKKKNGFYQSLKEPSPEKVSCHFHPNIDAINKCYLCQKNICQDCTRISKDIIGNSSKTQICLECVQCHHARLKPVHPESGIEL